MKHSREHMLLYAGYWPFARDYRPLRPWGWWRR